MGIEQQFAPRERWCRRQRADSRLWQPADITSNACHEDGLQLLTHLCSKEFPRVGIHDFLIELESLAGHVGLGDGTGDDAVADGYQSFVPSEALHAFLFHVSLNDDGICLTDEGLLIEHAFG